MQRRDQRIAVVGIGARLPGAHGPAGVWEMTHRRADVIATAPPNRERHLSTHDIDDPRFEKICRTGGFVGDWESFDSTAFGISAREAQLMDPQQRIVLETAFEAVADAGFTLDYLQRHRTGVVSGYITRDYWHSVRGDAGSDAMANVGNTGSGLSGRISHVFGVTGPSITIDTACSSGLSAVAVAIDNLALGHCSIALAAASNLILDPLETLSFYRSGMLAADSRCKFATTAADGFVRSDGFCAVVLRPLADAMAEGDRVYAVIESVAVGNDGGRSGSLPTPAVAGQVEVIRRALAAAGRTPGEIDYVEAHGTGTTVGDRVEIDGLTEVFAGRDRPLPIGSVKTRIGHCEAASGMAGLIVAALSLHHRSVPPMLAHGPLTEDLRTAARGVRALVGDDLPLTDSAVVGVSSFGITGTNAHAVLSAAPTATPHPALALPALPRLTSAAVVLDDPAGTTDARVLDAALAYRVNHSADDRRVDLEGDAGDGHPGLLGAVWGEKPTVVFAFGGFGAQWLGPSTVADPILRAHLRETYATVRAHMSEHERALLDGDGDIPPALQPYATFATQVAVAETLRDYGIVPDAVAGHSFGDLAAAVVAGALTAREGARLLAARTEAVREYARDTAMIVITGENVRDDARWLPDVADVAVVNSAHCVVVACASDRVDEVGTAAACHGYDARPLEVVFGSHSRFVERAVRAFEPATAIGDRTTPIPFYSSTVGAGARAGAVIEAGHWPANLGRRVELPPVAGRLAEDGHGVVIDIGPRPVLAAHLRGQFPGLVVAIDAAADAGFLRTTLGALFTAQVPFRPKRLPPWSSELAAALTWSRAARPIPSLRPAAHQGTGARDADRFVYRFTGEQVRLLTGHRVRGEAVAPGTLTLGCLADALGRTGDTVRLHDVRFLEPVALDEDTTELTLTITREQDDVRVSFSTGRDGEPALCATAVVEAVGDPVPVTLPLPLDLTPIPVDEFYAAFAAAGNAWTGPFRSIVELWASDTHAHVESELTTSCGLGRGIDPALLDAALHGVAAVRYRMAAGLSPRASFFFEGVDTLTFHRPLPSGRARTVIAPNATGDGYDVAVLDAEGRLAVHCAGLRIRPLAAAPDIAPLHRTWVPLALSARRVDRHIVRLRGTRLGEALDVAAVDPPRAEAACEAVVAAVGPGAELIVDLRGGVGTPGSSATDRLAALGMVLAHLARAAGEAGVPLALVTDDIEPADAADDGTVAVDPAALSENALSGTALSEATLSETTLSETTLSETTLSETTLSETTLSEATLSETRGDEFRSAAASFAFSLAGALPYEFPALQVVGIAVAGTGPLGALPSVLELAGRGEHRLRRDTGGLFRAARLSATRAPAAPRARRGAAWSALVRARADRRAELAVVWRDPEFGPRGIGSKRLPEGYDAVRALPDLLRAEADTTEPTRADPVTWPRALSPHATARLDEDAAIHPPHRRATAPTDAGRRVAVVVGGAGGLGRQLARDLLGRSFSRVVLVGTRKHPQTDDLGEHPEIHYLRCDIADPASVETIANRLAELRATETHLFQLAGRLSAGPLTELTHADWVRVLGPKVDGTRHLLELARRCDARMLVAYSSASAVLPSPQFAHYGAANAAMEGVLAAAADVRSAGVRWGFWSGPGMLRDLDSDREFAPDGVEQIDVQDGLGFLWHVLGEYGHDMPVCYPADWASVTARYPSLARDALLRELHEPAPGPSPHDAAPAATASTAERTSEVESLIMETLRITDVSLVRRAPKLRSLGLDSLLAVELRAKIKATFGRAVPIRTLLGPIDAGQLEAVVSGRASE